MRSICRAGKAASGKYCEYSDKGHHISSDQRRPNEGDDSHHKGGDGKISVGFPSPEGKSAQDCADQREKPGKAHQRLPNVPGWVIFHVSIEIIRITDKEGETAKEDG